MRQSASVRMIKLCEDMQSQAGHGLVDCPLLDAWCELNYRLQEEAMDVHINRPFIEQWMARLRTITSPSPQCFWLFLARINELALLCASRYVDCCEFSAADEFLVEACPILLQFKEGRTAPSQEKRGRGVPLVPSLYHLLRGSGYMTEDYLLSVYRRIQRIVQVAEMLASLGIDNAEDISRKLSCMDVDQRKDFRSRLCLFDRKTFNEIGRALHLFMHLGTVDEKYVGKYLRG